MKEHVAKLNLDDEYYTEERCFITEVSNSGEDPGISIVRARVAPGVTTAWHRLQGTVERYAIISGEGRVEVGTESPHLVGPGDVVLIPPLCPQRISNTGRDDLVFFAICTPRFQNECYEDIEPDEET